MTTYRLPATLFVMAAGLAAAGGAMQRMSGPGSQPGLTLTHGGGFALVAALLGLVWCLKRRQASRKAFITASDGNTTFPIAGPYDSSGAARRELPHVQDQFDPDGRYQWDVQCTDDEALVGLANDYIKR